MRKLTVLARILGLLVMVAVPAFAQDARLAALADLAVANLEVLNPPTELIAGTNLNLTLRTTAANNGPSERMDTHLTRTAATSVHATVTPVLVESEVPALGLDELRLIDDVFTILCSAPLPKTFTFIADIAPLNPGDTDPDLSNNHAETQLVVECVIPVDIDIRPGHPNNPINLGSKGVFQVVIFSNPDYALDATTIDPATVDLAGTSAQQLGSGTYLTLERDVNGDGLTDLLIQIETEGLQLTPSDTQTILRAVTFDDIHVQGSDFVTLIPANK